MTALTLKLILAGGLLTALVILLAAIYPARAAWPRRNRKRNIF